MTVKTKTYKAEVKAAGDGEPEGTFEALVSVFGNVDHAGDRVMPGAFAKSLQRWSESGDPIPVVFSHRWDDLDAHVGEVVEAKETDDGLWVKGLLDVADDPAAAKVFRMLDRRRIKEFSFAYDVIDEAKADDGANDLNELDVIEVGPTLKGMNPDTVLYGAKRRRDAKVSVPLAGSVEQRQEAVRESVRQWASGQGDDTWAFVEATFDDSVVFTVDGDGMDTTHYQAGYTVDDEGTVTLSDPVEVELEATVRAASRGAKAGRVLSSKNETKLRQASDLLAEVLAGVESTSDDEAAKSNAKPEDPPGGKGEEQTVRSPADMRVVLNAELVDAEAA